jgi:hypothetical protein
MKIMNPQTTLGLLLAASALFPTVVVKAEFASAGHGIQPVAQGTVANGALYLETRATWTNQATPAKPYVIDTWFALPACDSVPVSRLNLTVWGGTANYTCDLAVQINGTNLSAANPLVFGSTNDANTVFSSTQPNVYGSGSGVWLVGLPVASDLIFKDGTSNHIQITITTPDSFDGRVNQVTLAAVYQKPALNNAFDYVLAEGSGDIYRTPSGAQTDKRTVNWGAANPASATVARLHALYTYGDTGQNDRLYFNGTQLGTDDVAGWDKTGTGLDYGPGVVDFDVLSLLAATNSATFSVAASDVPDTRETSLRPQWVAFEATRPAASAVSLAIALNAVITWPVDSGSYQLETRAAADSGEWTAVTNTPVVVNGQYTVILPPASAQQYYQLRKTN